MQILIHPRLRTTLPRALRRDLQARVWARHKSQAPRPSRRHEAVAPAPKDLTAATTSRTSSPAGAAAAAKLSVRRGPPERILVYYGGTGRSMFLGILRVTTILLFGGACLIVAPSCYDDENAWYITPLVVAGGALPMLFVAYTSAPYVSFIHLALPAFARKSRETALHFAKDLPPTTSLILTTTRFNAIPRQTVVRLGDLIPDKSALRPVTFRTLNPAPRPWWMGKPVTQFFAADKSQPGRQSTAFYPELWPGIYKQIQSQASRPSR
ncbi:Uncharacterized protein PECH_006195 [Penicillium ucsense]|uniref:Uncharacterized protein n=1 Tax=Penicillium ucsense TaxID=2839758 RepID=A0A8J8WJM8_9EURO|nr:Uncharacterized protein PECM_006519 [Penicillium ucsense]KAF7735728.1 Uncharacterized protein PECH_006195 [Penicillium ucsense]